MGKFEKRDMSYIERLCWVLSDCEKQCPNCKNFMVEAINGDFYRCDWCIRIYNGQEMWKAEKEKRPVQVWVSEDLK